MRKLEKSKTFVGELVFLVFPSFLIKYSAYHDEISNWRLTMVSLMVTGIAAYSNEFKA
jgi:hypothetical protein